MSQYKLAGTMALIVRDRDQFVCTLRAENSYNKIRFIVKLSSSSQLQLQLNWDSPQDP